MGKSLKFDTSNLGEYDRDPAFESEKGIWIDFSGRKLRLLRAGGSNEKYTRYIQQVMRPHRRLIATGRELPTEVTESLVRKSYAHAVVADWKGVNDSEGNPIPCTPANVEAFFEAFPEIFDDVITIASNRASFQREFIEQVGADLGKS